MNGRDPIARLESVPEWRSRGTKATRGEGEGA
jgi:hypothetical protein